jgi:hypothetical protein
MNIITLLSKVVCTWQVSNAVVTAMMRMCDMQMQRVFESPTTQLTVNQAAGVAVNAAAAAAAAVLDGASNDYQHRPVQRQVF